MKMVKTTMTVAHPTLTGMIEKNPEVDLKNLVVNVGVDNDEVNDLEDKDTFHLNDGFTGNKDTANDRV